MIYMYVVITAETKLALTVAPRALNILTLAKFFICEYGIHLKVSLMFSPSSPEYHTKDF